MGKEDNSIKETLAMKIMLLRDKERKGEISFEKALEEAVQMIKEYDR
jgi:hypothetical protein